MDKLREPDQFFLKEKSVTVKTLKPRKKILRKKVAPPLTKQMTVKDKVSSFTNDLMLE